MSQSTTVRGITWLDDLRRDVRFGLRSLRRSPAFTVVAVLCLTLGIGANAALFSVLNAVLLRPLPYPEPDRLIRVYETFGGQGRTGSVSPPNYRDWVEQSTGFEALAAWLAGGHHPPGGGEPRADPDGGGPPQPLPDAARARPPGPRLLSWAGRAGPFPGRGD